MNAFSAFVKSGSTEPSGLPMGRPSAERRNSLVLCFFEELLEYKILSSAPELLHQERYILIGRLFYARYSRGNTVDFTSLHLVCFPYLHYMLAL